MDFANRMLSAVAFAACNEAELIVEVYKAATKSMSEDVAARRLVLRCIRESLFKSTPVIGVPRLLNAYFHLSKAVPDGEFVDETSDRDLLNCEKLGDQTTRGATYMREVFGVSDADAFINKMTSNWPDLYTVVVPLVYGIFQSDLSILDRIATSQIAIATLTCIDCPDEVAWHWRGLINNGGTREQAEKTTMIAKQICDITGVRLKRKFYSMEESISNDSLIAKHVA